MDIRVKRIDKSLPLPEYQTDGAIAFDLYAREQTIIPAKGIGMVPSNLIIEIPKGYGLLLTARSSLAKKKGLIPANGVGTIDADYCGDTDEIKLSLYNFSDNESTIERGERLMQGIFLPIQRGVWQEVDEMQKADRGGFGTTGDF